MEKIVIVGEHSMFVAPDAIREQLRQLGIEDEAQQDQIFHKLATIALEFEQESATTKDWINLGPPHKITTEVIYEHLGSPDQE